MIYLPNTLNCTNSINLAHELRQLDATENYRMLTLDITDIYVNIPTDYIPRITRTWLQYNNIEPTLQQQTIHTLKTILQQNYFLHNNTIYQPTKGVAMGSPISGLIAEIFLQFYENLNIKHQLENKALIFYTRYVDDIIYDSTKTTYQQIVQQANTIHIDLTLNYSWENDNTINFLDIIIYRDNNTFNINIYRKPTTTDTIIHFRYCRAHFHISFYIMTFYWILGPPFWL
jgi:hypothetical protein